jgi:integrase
VELTRKAARGPVVAKVPIVHDARHRCATLLVDLDVHPRVILRILRHAGQAVTMEIYAPLYTSLTSKTAHS